MSSNMETKQKYIFIVDKGIKEIWYDGELIKRWKGNPLASDIALFIYEQGWHTNISVSDEVWHKYLTKEIGRLIDA